MNTRTTKTTTTRPKKATTRKTKQTKSRTKSTAVKKTVAKKQSTKTSARHSRAAMVTATPEKAFWVCDGAVLHNLVELEAAFGVMKKESYSYHVQNERHDFADWVDQVLDDGECAAKIRKARTPATAAKAVAVCTKRYH